MGTSLATTMGQVGTGVQIAGVVGQTVGAYNKSKGEKAAYEYQSKVASNNEQLAMWQAQDAIERGNVNENNSRRKTAQLKSSQTASLAARGLDLGEGSALNILSDTDFMGERDALMIRDNAANEAYGHRTQASNYRSNAEVLKNRADAESPFGSAMGTLLTGAGSVAAGWYSRNNKV